MQRSVSYKFDNILVLDYYLSVAVRSPPSGHCSRIEGRRDAGKQEGNEGWEGGKEVEKDEGIVEEDKKKSQSLRWISSS